MPIPDDFSISVDRRVNQIEEIYRKVLYLLENDDTVFRNKDLSLKSLGIITGTNTSYLSEAINKHFECNFKTLINRYRLMYFIRNFTDPKVDKTIQKLIDDCGFNSQSAFYAAFKKEVKMPPRTYRAFINYYNKYQKDNLTEKESP